MSHRSSASISSATSNGSSQRRKEDGLEFQELKQGNRSRTSSLASDFSLDDPLPVKSSKQSWLPSRRLVSIGIGLCILAFFVVMFFSEESQPPSGRYLQIGKVSSDRASKTVVLASYPGQKLSWTKDVPDDWSVLRYNLDGREHHTYLHYIINNYHNLPDYTVFMHGHVQAWHQIEPAAWKIRALNLTALDTESFINFRCSHEMGCTRGQIDDEPDTFLGASHEPPSYGPLERRVGLMTGLLWKEVLEPQGFGKYPEEIGSLCCSQFAVTKEAIQSRTFEFWRSIQDPLQQNQRIWQQKLGSHWNADTSGNVYEYLWHILFGRPAVDCVDTDICRKEFFSDAISCVPGPSRPKKYKSYHCTNQWDPGNPWNG